MRNPTRWTIIAALAASCLLTDVGCSTLKPTPEREAQMDRIPWGTKAQPEKSPDSGAGIIASLLQMFLSK